MWEIEEKNIPHATNGERFNKLFIAFESSVFVVLLLGEKEKEHVTMFRNQCNDCISRNKGFTKRKDNKLFPTINLSFFSNNEWSTIFDIIVFFSTQEPLISFQLYNNKISFHHWNQISLSLYRIKFIVASKYTKFRVDRGNFPFFFVNRKINSTRLIISDNLWCKFYL